MNKIYKVVALIGAIASGKDTAEGYIKHQIANFCQDIDYKPLSLNSSILLDQEVAKQFPGEKVTRPLKQLISSKWEREDPNHIVDHLFSQIEESPEPNLICIVNSVRTPEQAERWLRLVPKITFVYLFADKKIRHKRYNKRAVKENQRQISFEEFQELHHSIVDSQIRSLRKYVLPGNTFDNSFDLDKLYRDINGVMSDIL